MRKYKIKLWALINIFLVFLFDRLSKNYVLAHFTYNTTYVYFKVLTAKFNFGLNLFLTYNKGTAFSIIKQAIGNVRTALILATLMITSIMFYSFVKINPREKLLLISLSLILGGAIGNIYDRIKLGYVIDFIDVYAGRYHWPVFNIADSAITVGAFLLIYKLIKN